MRRVSTLARGAAAGVLLTVALGACGPVACRPSTIVVAKKEERARPETPPGIRITETGRIEQPLMVIGRDYWVQAEDGSWHPVSAAQYDSVEVGGRLELCQ
jgi:hypothetical protein